MKKPRKYKHKYSLGISMLTHCAIMRRVKDFLKTKCDNEKPIPTKKNPQIIMFLKYFLDEKKSSVYEQRGKNDIP